MNLCLFLYLASIETDRQFILLSYLRELCVPLVSRSLSLPLSSLRQQLVKINHTATGTTYKVGQNAPRGNVWWLGKERETEWIMPWFMCQISAMLSASSPIPDDLHWLFSCHTLSLSPSFSLFISLSRQFPATDHQTAAHRWAAFQGGATEQGERQTVHYWVRGRWTTGTGVST